MFCDNAAMLRIRSTFVEWNARIAGAMGELRDAAQSADYSATEIESEQHHFFSCAWTLAHRAADVRLVQSSSTPNDLREDAMKIFVKAICRNI